MSALETKSLTLTESPKVVHVTSLVDRFPDFNISLGILNSKSEMNNLANLSIQSSY